MPTRPPPTTPSGENTTRRGGADAATVPQQTTPAATASPSPGPPQLPLFRVQLFPHKETAVFNGVLQVVAAGCHFAPVERDLPIGGVIRIGRRIDRPTSTRAAPVTADLDAPAATAGNATASTVPPHHRRELSTGSPRRTSILPVFDSLTGPLLAPAPALDPPAVDDLHAAGASTTNSPATSPSTSPAFPRLARSHRGSLFRTRSPRDQAAATTTGAVEDDRRVSLSSEMDPDSDLGGPAAAASIETDSATPSAPPAVEASRHSRPYSSGNDGSGQSRRRHRSRGGGSGGGRNNSSSRSNTVVFKSKVVSRDHAEIFVSEDGHLMIRDVGSSSGTFLNRMRFSPSGHASAPFPLKSGDVVQLGVDYHGGHDGRHEDIYKCVLMKVFFTKITKEPDQLNPLRLKVALRALLAAMNPNAKNASEASVTECCICLNSLSAQQALFLAPCSHCFHYRCVVPLVGASIMFQCPLCRRVANLDASIVDDDVAAAAAVSASPPPTDDRETSGSLQDWFRGIVDLFDGGSLTAPSPPLADSAVLPPPSTLPRPDATTPRAVDRASSIAEQGSIHETVASADRPPAGGLFSSVPRPNRTLAPDQIFAVDPAAAALLADLLAEISQGRREELLARHLPQLSGLPSTADVTGVSPAPPSPAPSPSASPLAKPPALLALPTPDHTASAAVAGNRTSWAVAATVQPSPADDDTAAAATSTSASSSAVAHPRKSTSRPRRLFGVGGSGASGAAHDAAAPVSRSSVDLAPPQPAEGRGRRTSTGPHGTGARSWMF
ncbi:hypothetical protein HK405_006841, partial [Cladochytrium tenue]